MNRGVTGQIIEDVEGPNPVAVVIDLDGNDELDITSAEALVRLADKLAKRGVPFAIAHLHGPAAAIAAKVELLDKVGEGHVFGNLSTAVRWATTLSQATGEQRAEPSVDGSARIHIDALLVTPTATSPASRHRSRVMGALSPQSDNAQIGQHPAEGRARHPSTGWRCGHGKRLGCRCSGQDLRDAPRRAGCAQRL